MTENVVQHVRLVKTEVAVWIARIDPPRWDVVAGAWSLKAKVRERGQGPRGRRGRVGRTQGSNRHETLHGTAGDGTDVEVRRVPVQDPAALSPISTRLVYPLLGTSSIRTDNLRAIK